MSRHLHNPVVYFARITDGSRRFIKIGVTSDVGKRLLSLDSLSPYPIELLAAAPGGTSQEAWVHAKFRGYRVRGEWFDPAPQILAYAASVKASGKLPGAPPHGKSRDLRHVEPVRLLLAQNQINPRLLAKHLGLASAQFSPWDEHLPTKHCDDVIAFFALHGVIVTSDRLFAKQPVTERLAA